MDRLGLDDLADKSLWYDRKGKPITLLEYDRLFRNHQYRTIGKARVRDVEVSTVWIGIDMGYTRKGPPVIFETMVFGGRHDQEQWRYSTEEAALAGHHEVVEMLSRPLPELSGHDLVMASLDPLIAEAIARAHK